jgi:hypothetical protein
MVNPTPIKTWVDGDVLLAADLNAVQAALPSTYRQVSTVTVTGTLSESDLNTVTIKGNELGATGAMRFQFVCTKTGTAAAHTVKIKVGGNTILSHAQYWAGQTFVIDLLVQNTATNAQRNVATLVASWDSTNHNSDTDVAYVTTAVDTTADFIVKATVTLGNVGDSVSGYLLVGDEIVI